MLVTEDHNRQLPLQHAPYPLLQVSLISTNGADLYPRPALSNLTPINPADFLPNVFLTIPPSKGTATAPVPPPPNKFTFIPAQSKGGPV